MAKVSPIQQSFNSGEFSPILQGRTDIENYKYAVETCLNFLPLVQGPVTRRSGSVFAAEARFSDKSTRVVRFEFSTTQAYILEFGHLYMRVYKDNAQVTLAGQSITAISQANPAVVTYAGADTYANGDRVAVTSVSGMTQVNNREFTVANVNAGANTFELSGVNSTGYDAYTSGGTVSEIYEIATPYVEADLFALDIRTQSADTLYVFHNGYAPRKITRTAHTSWSIGVIDFRDGPYLPVNITATTITPSATTGAGITLTASTAIFAPTDVDRLVRIKHTGTWGYAKIVGFTSSTVVTADVKSNFAAITASVDWRFGVWSTTTGFPAAGTFYEDRLCLGGPTLYPNRADLSKSSDYENFAPTATDGTVADDNAITVTLSARDVQTIRWMVDDEKALLIGATGGVWSVKSASTAAALSPTSRSVKKATRVGSALALPTQAGKATLFVQRAGRKVLSLAYAANTDGFEAVETTRLSTHATTSGVKEMFYQEEPYNINWVVRNDGVLAALTFNEADNVQAWHSHAIGGAFGSGAPVVESVAGIPNVAGDQDEVWFVVKRTINGTTKRYIEYFKRHFQAEDAQEDGYFVDGGLTYDGAPTTTLTGLNHLEGQVVTILADGATHPNKTVTAGKISLDRSSSVVHVGLGYNSDLQLLRIDAGAEDGTAQGKEQRIHSVVIRLYRSLNLSVGPDFQHLDLITFRESSDATGTAVPLYTGDKRVEFGGDYTIDARICIRQSYPCPCTVIAVMPQLVTQDRG